MLIRVPKIELNKDGCHAGWNEYPWSGVSPVLLSGFMGRRPDHFPRTEVKAAYDDISIHIYFRVEDRYVKSVAEEHQGNVWEDSCVEFFFTPSSSDTESYFNLEMNCCGKMLFHFHPEGRREGVVIPENICSSIRSIHTYSGKVEPEIETPVIWRASYHLPLSIVESYHKGFTKPAEGVRWRANFYKCADRTSHPHWLTWAPVDYPKPNFHLPQFFGIMEFA